MYIWCGMMYFVYVGSEEVRLLLWEFLEECRLWLEVWWESMLERCVCECLWCKFFRLVRLLLFLLWLWINFGFKFFLWLLWCMCVVCGWLMDLGREWFVDWLRLFVGLVRDEEMLCICVLCWLKKLLWWVVFEIGESECEDGLFLDGMVESWEFYWCGCDWIIEGLLWLLSLVNVFWLLFFFWIDGGM